MKDEKKFSFYIAGVKFHRYADVRDLIKEGDYLELMPEPENPYDPNAVRIIYNIDRGKFVEPIMLGHVPMKMKQSQMVAEALMNYPDYDCIVKRHEPDRPPYEALKVELTFHE